MYFAASHERAMIRRMLLTAERLREVLSKKKGLADLIVWREGYKFYAVLLSPTYEGVDEAHRQAEAWGLVLDNLSDDEQAMVGFMYTNTPEEQAQAERDAAADAP